MKKSEIYLAGGCFWGLQKYLDTEVTGVLETEAGYANGRTDTVKYSDLHQLKTGFCETIKVIYDSDSISLPSLLNEFYYTIDPTTINRQGPDVGSQYRTGIFYINESDRNIIEQSLRTLQTKYKEPIVVECKPLTKYIKAEDYHQNYLDKNPTGYCHINFNKIKKLKSAVVDPSLYKKKPRKELLNVLTSIQYSVTQDHITEEPFNNEFYNHFEKGLYVDITTGEPLFWSKHKFDAGTGFASFSQPVDPNCIIETPDVLDENLNIEAISRVGKAHLGHVFENEGTNSKTYSINSASLRFIPYDKISSEGYGYLL